MKKVLVLLIIFLLNLMSTTIAVASEHDHGLESHHSHAASQAHMEDIDSSKGGEPVGCDEDQCCGHCHHSLGFLLSVSVLDPSPFLAMISFSYKPLSAPQNFIDISKPPLV